MRCAAFVGVSLFALGLSGCVADAGRNGSLLLVGGGLDDDQAAVYRRLVELAADAARPAGAPLRVVVATAATGPEDEEATDKTESLRVWAPAAEVVVVRRATSTADTVAAIDGASAMFFTGGDQQRITDRYRPGGADSPEWLAMQRLLRRGGVIGGGSAGAAMMGEVMFTDGSSARALSASGAEAPLGPQLAPGMNFLPWLVTDSHFFERDRVGRLVAGLEQSGRRFGVGIDEVGAVAIDLGTGLLTGVTEAEALLVDIGALRRDGASRRGLVARLVWNGDRVALREWVARPVPTPAPRPQPARDHRVPIAEPGQNRQLASWRLFRLACAAAADETWTLAFDGWRVVAWAGGAGLVVFDVEVDA